MASSKAWVSAYRIVAPHWVSTAFSGEGAAKYGGRWNSPGHRVVYAAACRSLAALELLVHLTTPGSRAKPYRIIEVKIPKADILEAPPGGHWQTIGDAWLASGKSLAMRVPSVLIPEEPNFLIHPNHPGFANIRIGKPVEFRFDERL